MFLHDGLPERPGLRASQAGVSRAKDLFCTTDALCNCGPRLASDNRALALKDGSNGYVRDV